MFMGLGMCVPLLQAQNLRTLTTDELFQKGMENSLKIKALQVNVQIAEEQEKTAKTNRFPAVGLNITEGYLPDVTILSPDLSHSTDSKMPHWLQNYDVTAVQPLYTGGKIKGNIEKAGLQKEIASLDVERNQADIKLLLMEKYLSLIKLYKEREVLNENIKEAKQRLHDIEGMKREGMITQNDMLRSRLELTNYELALREVNDNIEIVSQQLDIALGLDEKIIINPDTTILNQSHALTSYEQYVEDAYNQFPELKITRFKTAVAEKNLTLAKADYFPSLALRAGNYLDRPILKTVPPVDLFTNSWNVSLVLSYNLNSLYQNKHNVDAGKKVVLYQQIQEEELQQNIRKDVKTAYIKHKQAIDRVGVLQISVQQADENYRIVNNKYLNQLAVLTDLLDATSVRLRTELQLTEARTYVVLTYYQLLKASGKL